MQLRGKARSQARFVPIPHPSLPAAVTQCCTASSLLARAESMSTGGESPLIGDITTLTTRLDGLSADQNPEILSSTLKIAFTERELYKRYIYSLAEDTERAKALLEVFDKVCP